MTDSIKLSLMRTPTFTKGAARTVALFGLLDGYNTARTPKDADRRALQEDWKSVGRDITNAIKQYGKNSAK